MANRSATILTRKKLTTGGGLPGDALFGEGFVNAYDGILKYSGVTGGSFETSSESGVFEVGSRLFNSSISNRLSINSKFVISGDTGTISTYEGVNGSGLTGKFLSGTTDGFVLANITNIADSLDPTKVQPGSNIATGGTIALPIVSLVDSPSVNNLSVSGVSTITTATITNADVTNLSGVTIYSGSTDLDSVIRTIASETELLDVTRVGNGLNTYTGGTDNSPTVNISGGTLDNLTVTNDTVLNGVYAVNLSGGSIYSGSTNLEDLFLTAADINSPFSGNSINGAISTISGSNISSGSYSIVNGGKQNVASGSYSNAQGFKTSATTFSSHAEGQYTLASGDQSHAEGENTTASGSGSHSEGFHTIASGDQSHAAGFYSIASGQGSTATGYRTEATSSFANAQGFKTSATTLASHAEGQYTLVTGSFGHAEGLSTTAGSQAHAEGQYSKALGASSHAEGFNTTANGQSSHAEGGYTTASGVASHAEGYSTQALGDQSHAGGYGTTADTQYSFVHGRSSIAGGAESAILGGNNNELTSSAARSVVLGGQNITGTESDTVYGINFNAQGSVSATTFYSGSTDLSSIFLTETGGFTDQQVAYAGTDGVLTGEAGFTYDAVNNELKTPSIVIGNPATTADTTATVYGNILLIGDAISGFTSELYIEDNKIELNFNPTASTESTSLGSGWSIQDGSGTPGTDVFFDIRGASTGISNRAFTTNLEDVRIRETGTISSPNGVRLLAELDVLDGGTF